MAEELILILNGMQIHAIFFPEFSLLTSVRLQPINCQNSWPCKAQELLRIVALSDGFGQNLIHLLSLESRGMIRKPPRNHESRSCGSGNRLHPKRFGRVMAGVKDV